jgi:hypothetical protein
MPTNLVRPLALALTLGCLAFSSSSNRLNTPQNPPVDPELTAHEWGTFTSVADRTGQSVVWHPRDVVYELPDFVEHFRTADFKTSLRGTVRMETPILYFYSPRETTISVKVGFFRGVITEWYPHASHVEPNPKAVLKEDNLYKHSASGGITWDSVTLAPGLANSFPAGDRNSHYYFARDTQATPLIVSAPTEEQHEKFLFYRGVSAFSPPISAKTTADGKLLVKNLGDEEIPAVLLFEVRGHRFGYRISRAVQKEVLLDPPELKDYSEATSEFQEVLESQGLNNDEALAMLNTWGDSWREEGSRLFYIVPRHFVDQVLPLTISPAPAKVVRVFVGRLELITPATEQAVATALAHHDRDLIDKYSRFVEPILDQMKQEDPAHANQLDKDLNTTYSLQPTQPPAQ